MRVRLASGSVRLRVDHAEFDRLLAGQALHLRVAVPGGEWRVDVSVAGAFALRVDGPALTVLLPAAELAGLAPRLPSREGLAWPAGGADAPLQVVLEVDLLDPARPRRPPR